MKNTKIMQIINLLLFIETLARVLEYAVCSSKVAETERVAWRRQATITSISGNWGTWSSMDMCPQGTFGTSVQVQIESALILGDDTGLNSVQMICSPLNRVANKTVAIFGRKGWWGDWSEPAVCLKGFTGFSMKIEKERGYLDDTAAVAVKFLCGTNIGNTQIIGYELQFGYNWGSLSHCPYKMAVCGINTKIEDPQEDGDDTSLNGIQIQCCGIPEDEGTEILRTPVLSENFWGRWGTMDECADGYVVKKARSKLTPFNTAFNGLNSIALSCGNSTDTKDVEGIQLQSHGGSLGNWTRFYACTHGFTGFKLQVSASPSLNDKFAISGIELVCESKLILIGQRLIYSHWLPTQHCSPGYYICGMQTAIVPDEYKEEDKVLTDLIVKCCLVHLAF